MVGQNIKQMRELKGWSQEQLARMMGYKSKSTIANAHFPQICGLNCHLLHT